LNTIELFLKLLSFESITPSDAGSLQFIKEYLSDFETIEIDKNDVKNLFLYKKFGDGAHLCFAGHVDVVPAGDGWSTNPFVPVVKDGIIQARGAQDMKSGVAAFVQALKECQEFRGTLSVLLTSDEEGDAVDGTNYALEILKAKNLLPDFCVVAEPTCEKVFGDAIKIGRRGSINGVLTLHGLQGHAAYPEKSINPIHQIAPILNQLAGVNLDDGDDFFAPSKFVITDIRSGIEATNVTPGKLKMMFNIRNSTKTTKEDVEAFIKSKFKHLNFKLQLTQSSFPFRTDPDSKIVKDLIFSIKEITNTNPKLSTAGGTSDARFIAKHGIAVVEFGVINDTIHAPNERTSIQEVEKLYEVFVNLIKKF